MANVIPYTRIAVNHAERNQSSVKSDIKTPIIPVPSANTDDDKTNKPIRAKSLIAQVTKGKVRLIMANIKSAKKRVLVAEANRQRNVAFKSSIKTAIKKALELAKSEDKEALNSALSKVYQLCDKAVVKGILHKNTAARKKSRLTLAVKKLAETK